MTNKPILAADPAKPDAPVTPAPGHVTPPVQKPDADKVTAPSAPK